MIAAVMAAALLAGCSGLDYAQQRTVTGTVGGTAGLDAAAGAGLLGGLVYDKVQKEQRSAYDEGYAAGQRRYR